MHITINQTQELQAACKKALTSAAFEKYVAKFVGQAVLEAFIDQQAQSAGIVLMPKQTTNLEFNDSGVACSYEVWSADGTSVFRMQRSFENLKAPERRHHWYGSERHTDSLGRVWQTSLPHMVQDDFGVLVEVAA